MLHENTKATFLDLLASTVGTTIFVCESIARSATVDYLVSLLREAGLSPESPASPEAAVRAVDDYGWIYIAKAEDFTVPLTIESYDAWAKKSFEISGIPLEEPQGGSCLRVILVVRSTRSFNTLWSGEKRSILSTVDVQPRSAENEKLVIGFIQNFGAVATPQAIEAACKHFLETGEGEAKAPPPGVLENWELLVKGQVTIEKREHEYKACFLPSNIDPFRMAKTVASLMNLSSGGFLWIGVSEPPAVGDPFKITGLVDEDMRIFTLGLPGNTSKVRFKGGEAVQRACVKKIGRYFLDRSLLDSSITAHTMAKADKRVVVLEIKPSKEPVFIYDYVLANELGSDGYMKDAIYFTDCNDQGQLIGLKKFIYFERLVGEVKPVNPRDLRKYVVARFSENLNR